MSDNESEVNVALERLLSYKASLNLLRGRRYNLQIEERVEASAADAGFSDVDLPKVLTQLDACQNFVGDLMNWRLGVKTIKTNKISASCEDACKTSSKIEHAIYEISALSSCLIPRQSVDDREFYNLSLKYSKTMAQYSDYLARKQASIIGNQNVSMEERIEKAKRDVNKINTSRKIMNLLIAAFVSDHEAYPEINTFRSSTRRDFVLEDFLDDAFNDD